MAETGTVQKISGGILEQGIFKASRKWPTELWKEPWQIPGYRRAAALLIGIFVVGLGVAVGLGELSRWAGVLEDFFVRFASQKGWAPWTGPGIWMMIKALIVLHLILFNGLFLVWWERKISAHMQSRLGPMNVGGWHGWAQTIADGLKLFLKEDVVPHVADHWVHRFAPVVAFVPVFLCFAPVPFGHDMAAVNLDTGVLYVFALSGISVIGLVMAGWGSGNKYSLLGGLRSAAQMVSYELPRAFAIVPILMLAGTLSLHGIAESQTGNWFHVIPRWFIFYPVIGQIAFIIYLIASVAETNRTPFDIPEAESELVAGFHTEYSGMKFSIFFLSEYAYVFLSACLGATLFLGGGSAPWPFLAFIPSWAWFVGKILFIMFLFLWFRWTFPRFRVDRLMDFAWKFLLPWSFANIVFAGIPLLIK